MRQALQTAYQLTSSSAPIPAPTGGWDAVTPLAEMPPNRAVRLDNWYPQPGYVEVRRGCTPQATSLGTGAVETLMPYHAVNPSNSKMFAAANNSIYNVTVALSPSLQNSGYGNNRWQSCEFATSGGNFLVAVNGSDAPLNYDGTSWTTPTITGTGIDPTAFIHINAHKSRLWFVINNSLDAAYLPVSSIAGTAVKFPLGALATLGGYLVAMGTWTHDAGSGPDDYAVFITSRGQVIVYQGTDPSSSTTWALVGIYELGRPLGRRCFTRVAGDIAIINIDGVLPLSKALNTDRGAAVGIAITANINNAMNISAQSYGNNFGWELVRYPKRTMAILNIPTQQNVTAVQYVMNTLTGAWCQFTGWSANTFAVLNDTLYFGGNDGSVQKADTGSSDNGTAISAIGQTAYNYLGDPAHIKQVSMLQPLIVTNGVSVPSLATSVDFDSSNVNLATPTVAVSVMSAYDTAVYDTATYAADSFTLTNWTGATGIGRAISAHFWALVNLDLSTVTLQLNAFNVVTQRGGYL